MAIACAVSRGCSLNIYDKKGRQLSEISSGGGPKDWVAGPYGFAGQHPSR